MGDHTIDALVREQRQTRHAPRDARCERCRDRRHLVPLPEGRTLCYACRRAEAGAGPTEADHPARRANLAGLTVTLHANDHRTVTEWRTRLGMDDWPAADGDPLLVCAHFLAGVATLLLLVAEWLVAAANHVARALGPQGWEGVRAAPLVP